MTKGGTAGGGAELGQGAGGVSTQFSWAKLSFLLLLVGIPVYVLLGHEAGVRRSGGTRGVPVEIKTVPDIKITGPAPVIHQPNAGSRGSEEARTKAQQFRVEEETHENGDGDGDIIGLKPRPTLPPRSAFSGSAPLGSSALVRRRKKPGNTEHGPMRWQGSDCFVHLQLTKAHAIQELCHSVGDGLVPEEGVNRDHCKLLKKGCGMWSAGRWEPAIDIAERQKYNVTPEPPTSEPETLLPQCTYQELVQHNISQGQGKVLSPDESSSDRSSTPKWSMAKEPGFFKLQSDQCEFSYAPTEDVLAELVRLQHPGRFNNNDQTPRTTIKRIVFSGDSMVRQTFLRLVALLREHHSALSGTARGSDVPIIEQPLHGHIKYCVFGSFSFTKGKETGMVTPTSDQLQYQLWKYWKNENGRLKEGTKKYKNLGFEEGPTMTGCQRIQRDRFLRGRPVGSGVLLEMDFVWDPFQSRPYPKVRSSREPLALQVHSYMYWMWSAGLGPADPQGVLPYLAETKLYLSQRLDSALNSAPPEGWTGSHFEAWLARHSFKFYYPLTPRDMSGRVGPGAPAVTEEALNEEGASTIFTRPTDPTIAKRNEIVADWAIQTRRDIRAKVSAWVIEHDNKSITTAPTSGGTTSAATPATGKSDETLSQHIISRISTELIQVSTLDFPGITRLGGQRKLPRKDGHFMCGWTPKVPAFVTGVVGDRGQGCRDPTNLALVQWVMNLVRTAPN